MDTEQERLLNIELPAIVLIGTRELSFNELLDLKADLAQVDVQVFKDIGADPGALLDQAQQDVLGPDVFVVKTLGLLVCQGHYLAGPICESFEHRKLSVVLDLVNYSCESPPGRQRPLHQLYTHIPGSPTRSSIAFIGTIATDRQSRRIWITTPSQ